MKSWLTRVGVNLALNFLRRRNRTKELLFGEYADEDTEYVLQKALTDFATPGPESQLIRRSEREFIRSLVAELPEEKRLVLEMIDQQDFSIRDVSRRLGIPGGTVKSRLFYARKILSGKIRDALEG